MTSKTAVNAPGVVVVRIAAPLFFGDADYVRDRIREPANGHEAVHLVVIDGETSPSVDASSADISVLLRADLQRVGTDLVLGQKVGQARDVLHQATEHGEAAISQRQTQPSRVAVRMPMPMSIEPTR